jgi:hypothetical protein
MLKSQSQLADATADMRRAYAIASARAASSSLYQGMYFWARMLHPVPVFPAASSDLPCAAPSAEGRAARPEPEQLPEMATQQPFASYRSAGGHASAQVIMAEPAH